MQRTSESGKATQMSDISQDRFSFKRSKSAQKKLSYQQGFFFSSDVKSWTSCVYIRIFCVRVCVCACTKQYIAMKIGKAFPEMCRYENIFNALIMYVQRSPLKKFDSKYTYSLDQILLEYQFTRLKIIFSRQFA
jgi:hypothetical protein